MKKLIVEATSKTYPIYITDSFNSVGKALESSGISCKKACIVVDSNVKVLYLEAVKKELSKVFTSLSVCVFPAGEENKNLDTVQALYKSFFENKLDRKSVVIALGGGVTGDMAGFAASTYMRSISFIQIPTTLLSQVDSSVGGKTGVDFMNTKNIIGSFYQPEFVYINVETLKTLPEKEFVSGMGEVIKHGFLRDKKYLDFLKANRDKINMRDSETMKELVYSSCKIKAEVVGMDEKEQGIRETLNFGHTFGHAVESLYNFSMPHGHCVGIGMCAALYLSHVKGSISEEELENARSLITSFGLPDNAEGLDEGKLLENMLMDKKTKDGSINIILLNGIGHAYTYTKVTGEELLSGLSYVSKRRI